ncbi:MAG: hypothetical protein ABIJ20_00010 [Nanoarchaeota archaeon]|nr:hypothetical protein [Nanoarchaeota archaeon]MBU1445361.1 hypothetical protein [Nanoarchaeota archaeon]MBU2475240.1 hypothetical protein [Nanoarchaeota archaeon]
MKSKFKKLTTIIATLGIMGAATPALAGGNPNVRAYIDFDPPNYVHNIDPPEYTAFDAYIMLDNIDLGMTVVSFAVDIDGGITAPPSFESLLPGGLVIGDYDTGITLASTECKPDNPLSVAVLHCFSLGGSGKIRITDHPDYPRWVVDCNVPGQVDFYTTDIETEFGVGYVPVEEKSWGSIKAMYR